jgi:hypothetical protein
MLPQGPPVSQAPPPPKKKHSVPTVFIVLRILAVLGIGGGQWFDNPDADWLDQAGGLVHV